MNTKTRRIAINVGGGFIPGMNAVVKGAALARIHVKTKPPIGPWSNTIGVNFSASFDLKTITHHLDRSQRRIDY